LLFLWVDAAIYLLLHLKEGKIMKGTLTLLIRSLAMICLIFAGTYAFSQDDQASSKKKKVPKDNMPVIIPDSQDSLPVIYPDIKDPMPNINPDTASKLIPIENFKKKKVYRSTYN